MKIVYHAITGERTVVPLTQAEIDANAAEAVKVQAIVAAAAVREAARDRLKARPAGPVTRAEFNDLLDALGL